MSLEQAESSIKPSKKTLKIDKYFQQLQQIDLNNIGSWSSAVKLTMYVLILIFIAIIGYIVVIKGVLAEISSAKAQQTNLINEYREKDSKLRNLTRYHEQLKLMEEQFNQQLQQLPKETEIPDLVEDIHAAGIEANLNIKNIQLQTEIKKEIFIEQPIKIVVKGDYHAMGGFVSEIGLLPRIVTLHNFVIKADRAQAKAGAMPTLEMNIDAKTYRYIAEEADTKAGGKKNEKK